jgi:hypothetical protein
MKSASCSRPACPHKPAAWLAYDYNARCAWIDDQPEPPGDRSSRWPLCERHADNLQVPRGWSRVDRRASVRGTKNLDGPDFGPPGFDASDLDASDLDASDLDASDLDASDLDGNGDDSAAVAPPEVCSRIH